ncbi:hypothetical protein SLS58_000014 [Diplodia intermedia]|uniref:Uncharacterized protein n=1 Tax=Diplodia intermedia TaxID=856260 RepID=A0ABR3U5Z7_9PEZI
MEAYATTNSKSDNYEILIGIWTNWTRGSVLGRTLTLQRRDGDLLIAFIALFVTIVGTSLWRILCFGLHGFFSTEKTRDGVYHQRQAILRNSANGASGLIRFVQAMWAWRHRDSKPYRRIAPLITFTAFFLCVFGVASGFSSRVSTGIGNEVLVQTPDLGVSTGRNLTWAQILSIWSPCVLAQRALQCYTNDTNTANCNNFIKPRLEYLVQRNASCPFGADMCKLSNGNIFIDTGLLDFNDDLGVNLPPARRFQYRRTTHCAPIVTEGHKEKFLEGNATWHSTGKNWTKPAHTVYYYGQAPFENVTNATYEYETDIQDFAVKVNTAPAFYNIGTRQVYGMNGTVDPNSAFVPMPSLLRVDADVVLIFLSANEIGYSGAVDDPWYAAHQPYDRVIQFEGQNPGVSQIYHRDEPAAVLGCVLQEQICNPRTPERSRRCTPPGPWEDLTVSAMELVDGEDEAWLLQVLIWLSLNNQTPLWDIINTLGSSSLSSSFSLTNGMQAALPPDQWQRDVERWHSIMMASLQGSVVEVAEGPSAPELRAEYQKPANDGERALCRRQQLLRLRPLLHLRRRAASSSWPPGSSSRSSRSSSGRCRLDSYARLEWCANETLQLQRLAHEELGMGTWSKCDGDVPVTEKGERLAMLDLTDSKHPRLKARPVGWEEIVARGPTAGMQEVRDDGGGGTERNDGSCGGCDGKDPRCSVEEAVSPVSPTPPGSVDGSTLAEIAHVPMSLDDRHAGNCRLVDGRDAAAAREGM